MSHSTPSIEQYPAIILAGGLGTRLRSVVQDLPKPMAAINGKPFLHYLFLLVLFIWLTIKRLRLNYKILLKKFD
jgi:D-glycero-alpha-D-manno-heptose 1-phosphate guanylyltransferase